MKPLYEPNQRQFEKGNEPVKRAVLISIRPEYCDLIASGEKVLEVRKTRPSILPPFKCYIYQTHPKHGDWNDRDGRVVGEFVCDTFVHDLTCGNDHLFNDAACITEYYARKYANGKPLRGWHISGLKIYDKPKLLSEFKPLCSLRTPLGDCFYNFPFCEQQGNTLCGRTPCYKRVKRPPQSWMYVEDADA